VQAAVFEGIRTIRVQTLPDPEPTPDDIVIRVKACGICGSDLHSYTTGAFVKPGQRRVYGVKRTCALTSRGRPLPMVCPEHLPNTSASLRLRSTAMSLHYPGG
jgi:hypothetical protein